jgi:hypothetical protein
LRTNKATTRRRRQKKPVRRKLLMKNRLPQATPPEALHPMPLKPVQLDKLLSVSQNNSLEAQYAGLVM